MNKWISEYLSDPLLRKCGSSIQHLWWNGFYCECSWGKQAEHTLHMQHQDHLSWPGILRAPKSPPGIRSYLPAHLISYLSSVAHWAWVTHTLSFPQTPAFSLWAWRTPKFFASSGHISNVSSSERFSEFLPHTIHLISFLSFSNLSKKKFLSPEIDFIHLVHIIHHWVIKWAVGGEFGPWFPIHVSAVKGCVAWSKVSFINCGLEFWDPELSIPTQLPVYCDMTLPVLCLHQHRFTIPGNFSQEEKTTLLYIPRTYLKDQSIL